MRGVKLARHVTGCYATNSAGEALPPFYIFDSSAKNEDNFRVNTEWLVGLPTVVARYGCPTLVERDSYFAVCPKGSMDDTLLNDYIERVIMPLFPNMSKEASFDENGKLLSGPVIFKVDAGQGRIVSDKESIQKREEFKERGFIILMGLPNATSVQQEMDALYGPFKSATYVCGEVVAMEKLKARGLARRNGEATTAVLSLTFEDLSTVVNGEENDSIELKPFDSHFTKEKILWSWEKIGFVPFTWECLRNKKVRHELGQKKENVVLEALQKKYDALVNEVEELGFNVGVLAAEIPVAEHVQQEEDEDEQVKQLLAQKGVFSASAMWNHCSTRVGNAAVVMKVQKAQLAMEEEKAAAIAKSKDDAKAKQHDKARAALRKYHTNVDSLNTKDWGDVLRWVLPAAGVTVVLKEYTKKDAIIAKLQSLPEPWTSYIIPSDEPVQAAV